LAGRERPLPRKKYLPSKAPLEEDGIERSCLWESSWRSALASASPRYCCCDGTVKRGRSSGSGEGSSSSRG
jgi:hypothetical protein